MVTGLLDTSVLVDVLRKHAPALSWLAAQPQPGVTPVVWLELLEGVQNKEAERRALKVLKGFERIDLIPTDFDWAIEALLRFNLSHRVGMNDCLIAAVNHRLQIPLYTANLKHFTPMLGPLAQAPY